MGHGPGSPRPGGVSRVAGLKVLGFRGLGFRSSGFRFRAEGLVDLRLTVGF